VTQLQQSVRRIRHLLRAFAGKDPYARIQLRCDKVYLGNARATWCICPSELSGQSVIYSFGVGEDISFDLELIQRFGVEVHAFDPTPRSIAWIRSQGLPEKIKFHEYGVGAHDGTAVFRPPKNPSYVSYSTLSRGGDRAASVEAPVYRLTTIMKMLGSEKIDILKIDIEGAEFPVLQDLIASMVPVGQLLVEFHHRWPEVGPEKTKEALRNLDRAGFRIFDVSPTGEEYSFLRV
jgi:FkbM family methyltransferase